MSDIIVNGNIESSLKTAFQETIYELTRQNESYLSKTPAVLTKPFDGRVLGITRGGATELIEVTQRNQVKQYSNYLFDRRWAKKSTWHNSYLLDRADVNDAIADPTSALYNSILSAVNVLKDRVIIKAALGDIKIGSGTDGDLEVYTAEEDGVKTIDATANYGYDIIKRIKRNFSNQYIKNGIVIAQTANEESALLSDEKIISKDYENSLNNKFENGSLIKSLNCHIISDFAGSDNGSDGVGKILNPIIPEIGGSRFCIAMANGAIQMCMVEIEIDYTEKLQNYVNSSGVDVLVRAYAVRLEGSKVQGIETTI